jgi:toxin ParE1/3/4
MTAILAAVEFVKRNPLAAETTTIRGVRGKMVRKYGFKVFYRVLTGDDMIEIVHVRHAARKPWSGEND